MSPPTAVFAAAAASVTSHSHDSAPRITATHASNGSRGRGGHRGRRGARGGNGNGGVSGSEGASSSDSGAPSLLSRIGGRVDDASSADGSYSPTTPRAETSGRRNPLAVRGASLPPKPANGQGRRASNSSRKGAHLTLATSAPPVATTTDPCASTADKPNPDKPIPQSAPPDRPSFPKDPETDRPASALATSHAKDASIRGVSPTPRLSWADETDDDSLPDLDDWMTPALTSAVDGVKADGATVGGEDAGGAEDEEHTPVATSAPSGPLGSGRRKRGAGKKNKMLAAKAAENAASEGATPLATPKEESGLEGAVEKLSLKTDVKEHDTTKGKGKQKDKLRDKEEEVTTPKGDWRSIIPSSERDGAMQLLSALAGSIATSKPTYRTPAQRQAEGAISPTESGPTPTLAAANSSTAPPVDVKEQPREVHPVAVPAGPASSRVRAVPSPLPPPLNAPRGPTFAARQAARNVNGSGSALSSLRGPSGAGANAYRPELGDTPVLLPKKHARPVITADAITRLARGLMAAPPKREEHVSGGVGEGHESKAAESNPDP